MSLGSMFAALYAAHQVADHHVQSDREACTKGLPGREGRLACARHVASYTATAGIALAAAHLATGVRPRYGRIAAGLALSAVSHYVIDRREPLKRFAELAGNGGLYALGVTRNGRQDPNGPGTGPYVLDQSAHVGFLFVAALIISGGPS